MPSNIVVNYDYDKTELLELFNNSEKTTLTNFSGAISRNKAVLPNGIMSTPMFSKYIKAFNFLSTNDLTVEIFELREPMRPYITLRNNGWLIFPISGMQLILNTYSYVTPNRDENGRPLIDFKDMSDEEIGVIEETLVDSSPINQPIAVDGLTTFALRPTVEPFPILMTMKIDQSWDWATVYNYCKKML